MFFISVEDFLAKAGEKKRLSRQEEKELAVRMKAGDDAAREALVQSYFPFVAATIRRAPGEIRSLDTVYSCIDTLEKGVDTFDFLQEGETFAHHLSWRLRQCITRCLAER